MKASLAKSALAEIRRLPPEQREAVESKLRRQTIEAVDAASSLAWLDMELQTELDRATYEALGAEGLIQLTREWTKASTLTPLVAPVLRGSLSLFGSGTALVVKMLPRFWRMSSRDCGRIEVEVDAQGGTVSYVELPPLMRVAPFAAASEGAQWGVIDLFNEGRGTVKTDDSRLSDGIVAFTLRFD